MQGGLTWAKDKVQRNDERVLPSSLASPVVVPSSLVTDSGVQPSSVPPSSLLRSAAVTSSLAASAIAPSLLVTPSAEPSSLAPSVVVSSCLVLPAVGSSSLVASAVEPSVTVPLAESTSSLVSSCPCPPAVLASSLVPSATVQTSLPSFLVSCCSLPLRTTNVANQIAVRRARAEIRGRVLYGRGKPRPLRAYHVRQGFSSVASEVLQVEYMETDTMSPTSEVTDALVPGLPFVGSFGLGPLVCGPLVGPSLDLVAPFVAAPLESGPSVGISWPSFSPSVAGPFVFGADGDHSTASAAFSTAVKSACGDYVDPFLALVSPSVAAPSVAAPSVAAPSVAAPFVVAPSVAAPLESGPSVGLSWPSFSSSVSGPFVFGAAGDISSASVASSAAVTSACSDSVDPFLALVSPSVAAPSVAAPSVAAPSVAAPSVAAPFVATPSVAAALESGPSVGLSWPSFSPSVSGPFVFGAAVDLSSTPVVSSSTGGVVATSASSASGSLPVFSADEPFIDKIADEEDEYLDPFAEEIDKILDRNFDF
ncbi:hypothetical protein INT47_002678 [Mucor saturninus]|uniref:Uncharacterized protein n=1 Tax=Mucor saturninus TaxID=64648 RepID=A0A8H7UP58_9FUNG|nr:hypothetical protein INT47_002678 [Mucor saturninus]